jgi:hypothetical protein
MLRVGDDQQRLNGSLHSGRYLQFYRFIAASDDMFGPAFKSVSFFWLSLVNYFLT